MKRFIILAIIAVTAFTACDNNDSNKDKKLGSIRIVLPSGIEHDSVPVGTLLTAVYEGTVDKDQITYQWYKDETAIPNATLATLTPGTNGVYKVTAGAAGYESITSDPVNVPGDSMTFADDLDDPGREFTIFESLSFKVEFFAPYFVDLDQETLEAFDTLGIVPGLIVTGSVKETSDTWTSDTISGTATDMTCPTDPALATLFDTMNLAVDIVISYTKQGSNITDVLVDITGGDFFEVAEMLMDGSYIRKP